MDIETLLLASQGDDIKALEELIRRVQKQIYTMFFHLTEKKEDISDLTQDVLLKMARSIKQLKDVKNFKVWLNQIVINQYNDFLRRNPNKYIEFDEEKILEIKDKIGCEPGEKCFFAEIEKLVRISIMALPKELRLTLILREYEGLSYFDISKIMNISVGTVKSRISRARMKLQKELKEFI